MCCIQLSYPFNLLYSEKVPEFFFPFHDIGILKDYKPVIL